MYYTSWLWVFFFQSEYDLFKLQHNYQIELQTSNGYLKVEYLVQGFAGCRVKGRQDTDCVASLDRNTDPLGKEESGS